MHRSPDDKPGARSAFQDIANVLIAVKTSAHRTGSPVCGHQPGKEPLADIDRTVLITVHHEPTIPTAIRALSKRHGLLATTATTGLARMAFIYDFQDFPSQEAFVSEHLDKAIQPPVVVHRPMEGLLMLG